MKQIAVVTTSVLVGAALAVLVLDRDDERAERGADVIGPAPVVPVAHERVTVPNTELATGPSRVSAGIAQDTGSLSGDEQPLPTADAVNRLSDVELEAIVRTQEPFAADDSTFEKKYASMGVEDLEIAYKLAGRFTFEETTLLLPSVLASGDYSPTERKNGLTFYRSATTPDGQKVKVYFDPLKYPFIDMRAREQSWLVMRIRELGGDPGRYNTSRMRG